MTPPEIAAIVCTREGTDALRRAIAAIAAQTFSGVIETVVVFDHGAPDHSLAVVDGSRPVRVVVNDRTPGLPGGHNAGVAATVAPLVAFCGEGDVWAPEKVRRQVDVLRARPEVDVVVTGVRRVGVHGVHDQVPASPVLTLSDLLRSRVTEADLGTAMVRRRAFLHEIGPADEAIPGGFAEDYEWVLRAARRAPLGVVPEPLVRVEGPVPSWASARWQTIADALEYLIRRVPELRAVPSGLARLRGERSFALAALGRRREAWAEIRETLRQRWFEPRAYLAGAVAIGIVKPEPVIASLRRHGRGI